MLRGTFLLSLVTLVGCASRPAPSPMAVAQIDDEGAVAASLVIDPPFVAAEPPLDLPRDERHATAYAGFEEFSVTHYWLYQDDHQRDRAPSWGVRGFGGLRQDRFDRQAITQKVGVYYR